MDELNKLIERTIRLSYFRGIDADNPIDFRMQPNGKEDTTTWIILASLLEPTYARTPYNVLWLPMNPSDNNFGKLLRRRNHQASSFDYRSEWTIVTDIVDAYSEVQYYQAVLENAALYGIEDPNGAISSATTTDLGIVKLASSQGNTVYPVGVVTDDPRMDDDRYPTDHDHPNYARTMIKINATQYALVDSSTPPTLGMTLFLEAEHPTDANIFLAKWRFPVESDIDFTDVSLIALAIQGPSAMREQSSAEYSVWATFANGITEQVTPETWTLPTNPIAASIVRTTGILTTPNTTADATVKMEAKYTFEGITLTAKHDVNVTADVELASINIIGPDSVQSKSSTSYSVQAVFTDGSTSTVTPTNFTTASNKTSIASGPKLNVVEVFEDTSTVLTATYTIDGITKTATKTVTIKAEALVPMSIAIEGPTAINESSVTDYLVRVTYSDSTTALITPTTWAVTTNPSAASINVATGKLTVGNLSADTSIVMTATFTLNGKTVSDTHPVAIKNLVELESISILGPDSVQSNSSNAYTVQAVFSDGTMSTVIPKSFTTGNPSTSIVAGPKLNTSAVYEDESTLLSATYTHNGITKSATKTVLIEALVILPMTMTIEGPTVLNENSVTDYKVLVEYSDATSAYVTPTSWTVTTNPSAASIDRTTGKLTIGNLSADTNIVMTASFTSNGKTITDTHPVAIKTDVELVSIEILGAASIASKAAETYTVQAVFSDGTMSAITPSVFTSSSTKTTVSNTTKVTLAQLFVNENTTLSASFTFGGVTKTATKTVALVAEAVVPMSIKVLGDTQINEGEESGTYTYTVTYSDGTTKAVTTVNSLAVNNTAARVIVPNKIKVDSGNISTDTVVRLTATYTEAGKTVTGFIDVLVIDVLVVVPTAIKIRIAGQGDASASSHDENQGLTVLYSAEFNNNPGTWVDISADSGFTSTIIAPTNGSSLSADKKTLTLTDVVGTKTSTIQASITRNGVTKTVNYVVTILDTDIYLTNFRVRLATAPTGGNSSTQDENQTIGLVYSAIFSDAPSTWVTISNTDANLTATLTTANGATIAANKSSVTLPDVSGDKSVVIAATYAFEGVTKNDTYTLTVRDNTVTVTGFRIRLVTAPSATTSASTHQESQTLSILYQVERSNAPGVWASINGTSGLTAAIVAPANGVTFSSGDITKVILPDVSGDKTATVRGTYVVDGKTLTADYVFTITDVVITVLEFRARLESAPTSTVASSTHDEEQTIRMIYRARFSNAPSTWVDVSTDTKVAATIMTPTLGVTIGTDKRNIIIPDMTSDSSVVLRASYTLNGTVTLSDYTFLIKNVSVGSAVSPRYGMAPVQAYQADYATEAFYSKLTTGNLTGVNGEEITTGNSPDQQALWFMMYPKAWGYIYIVNKANGFAGSWDGGKITTQDGSFGSPAEATINGEAFYIYRVTFPYGNGPITWKVTYGSSSPDSGAL